MHKFEHSMQKEPAETPDLDALRRKEEEELEKEDRLYEEIDKLDVSDKRAIRELIEKIKTDRTRFLTSQEFSEAYLRAGIPEEAARLRVAGWNFTTLEVYLNTERIPQEFRDPLATHEAAELLFATRLPPLDDKKPAHQTALQYEYERAVELGLLDAYHAWNIGEFQKVIERSTPYSSAEALEEAREEIKYREQLFLRAKQELARKEKL